MKLFAGAVALAAATALSGAAQAAKIVAPVSVMVDSGGVANPTFFAIDNIIDQSGLSKTYLPGLTEFEDFVASDPTVTSALGTRWLSASATGAARLTFDFGQAVTLSKLALWDDLSTTISLIRMSTPELGNFRDLKVTDVLQTQAHAEVFTFQPVTTRYLTFEITGCNVGQVQNWPGCGLNEVVFAQGQTAAVPEPGSWALMIMGFGAAGALLRRRRAAFA
jgi:hypothetical protein